MSKLALPLTLVALALPGCLINSVTKLDPQASKVQVVPETEKPSDCKFLGKVTGTSHADDEKEARKGAENDLRNQTAKLKGNFVVLESTRGGRVGTTSQRDVVMNGKAYDCKTLDAQLAEEEKQQQAILEKEEKERKDKEEREAKLEEARRKADEAKAKAEAAEREAEEKEAAQKKSKGK